MNHLDQSGYTGQIMNMETLLSQHRLQERCVNTQTQKQLNKLGAWCFTLCLVKWSLCLPTVPKSFPFLSKQLFTEHDVEEQPVKPSDTEELLFDRWSDGDQMITIQLHVCLREADW